MRLFGRRRKINGRELKMNDRVIITGTVVEFNRYGHAIVKLDQPWHTNDGDRVWTWGQKYGSGKNNIDILVNN